MNNMKNETRKACTNEFDNNKKTTPISDKFIEV